MKKALLLPLLCIFVSASVLGQVRLKIAPNMLIDEKAYPHSNPYNLFDEQTLLGNSENLTLNAVTKWGDYLDASIYYPLSLVIDLGQSISVGNVYLYDGSGVGKLEFYSGSSNNWTLCFTDNFEGYNQWNKHAVNKPTRYLRIVFYTPDATFNEMVVFGDKQTIPPSITRGIKTYPTMDEFLGINIIHNRAPLGDVNVVKHLREFHEWSWDEGNQNTSYPGYPNNQYGFNPSWFDDATNFDKIYGDFKKNGNTIYPTLQSSAFWFLGDIHSDSTQNKPTKANRNPERPESYIEHADYMYQVAARYGNNKVADGNLKLRNNNGKTSGLNVLDGVEDWNEPNKNWEGRRGLFLPYEYAAMSSADYDGHEKTMGTTLGVKNADPSLKLIMGGLISLDSNYIKALKYWYDNNRTDKKFAVDVINFHNYCNDGTGQGAPATKGVSPEDFGLEEKTKAVVEYCNRTLPSHPVWVTEFGYDIQQSVSDQKAPPYGPYTAEQVQAMWNVRNFLAYAAAGIDRAYLYWLSDANSNSTTKFESSGLIAINNGNKSYRPSYYWVATLRNTLKNFSYSAKITSGNTNVMIQEYINPKSPDSVAYVFWCPTSNNTTVSNYNFKFPTNVSNAKLITPVLNSMKGNQSTLSLINNSTTLKITEDPVYILASKLTTQTKDIEAEHDISIFPNPSTSELHIKSEKQILEVQILDPTGATIEKIININSNSTNIDTSKLKTGLYNIRIKASNSIDWYNSKVFIK